MLVRVADWFANLPATPIAVPPPGAGLLYAVFLVVIFLLVVRISEANSQRHLRFIVPVILLLAGFIWASRPVADGILFARHVPQLILPVQAQADDKAANGGHSALAFATSQRQLSAFPGAACVGNPACCRPLSAWHAQQHSARCGCHASGRVKPRLPAATVGGLWPGGQTRFCNLSCAGTLSLSRRRPAKPCRCTKRQLPAVVARSGPARRPFDIAEQQRSVFTDQSGEPALNLDIICLEIAGLIVRVFRLQTNAARLFQQRFQRGFLLLDQCDNNVAMIGRA